MSLVQENEKEFSKNKSFYNFRIFVCKTMICVVRHFIFYIKILLS
ncbi:hypothetical protein LEP1GSC029_1651 [Leptospira interrogans str. 2002000626]|uniref:Uncharacterized protein n=1 Tax=Leptospira interrogans str. 2002000626 TaxID=996803 RepID=A0A829D2F8_LEPIR|nr:hypothetical protein LEP1GSC029_1651 [Leptospira interrogans str. 2002000626]